MGRFWFGALAFSPVTTTIPSSRPTPPPATNEAVSRAESIRTFEVLPTDFTVANGLLTPSLKVRRAEAEKRFAAEIDALYTRTPLVPSTTASPSQD